jgi:hypothetical protein
MEMTKKESNKNIVTIISVHQQHTTEGYADRHGQGPSIINFRTSEGEKQVHVPATLKH